MKAAVVALTTALLAGCATPPAALPAPDVVIPIRWVRQGPPQFEVRAGACVLYLADVEEQRAAADGLVRACAARGGLVPGAGDVDVHWLEVDTVAQLLRLRDQVYPPERAMPSLSIRPAMAGRGIDAFRITGFFSREGGAGPCTVVSLRGKPATLGHELKHCLDGFWHP